MRRSSGSRLALAAILLAGCGAGPAPAAPRPAVEPAVGAVAVPEEDLLVAPVPPELRAAPLFSYPGLEVARTDLSSLGPRLMIVPAEIASTPADLRLTFIDDGGTRLDLALGELTYSWPSTMHYSEVARGDAAYFVVSYTDFREGPNELAVFRLGDELRIAVRSAMRPEAWRVVRLIRLARGAEVRALQPDPH